MMKLDTGLITPLPASDSGSTAVWGSKRINPRPQSCLYLTCSGYPSNDDDDNPVINPIKPNNVSVVFDCAARCSNVSLNDNLMRDSDIMNSLIGVLTRFRKNRLAFVGDVEAMFHQPYSLFVKPEHANSLRFPW